MNVKKRKVKMFNSIDPCQEFMFEGDVIKRVQTFKYLGILFKTTSNLDSAVEHLVATNRRLLFMLNHVVQSYILWTLSYIVTFSTLWCVPQQAMLVRSGWIPRK
jgi:hypothetical protein